LRVLLYGVPPHIAVRGGQEGTSRVEPAQRALRADARRNRELIIAAAEELFLRDGANASLEEISRRAGVGSATLHRHFPSRKNLLEIVYLDRVRELCDAAAALAAADDPTRALIEWLCLVDARSAVNGGLAAAMAVDDDGRSPASLQSCHGMIATAGDVLLRRAIDSGAVRPDVDIHDLLALVNALAQVSQGSDTHRLLMLALNGIMTRPVG
jgi:AcrR family transcriptional regulator